MRAPRLRRNAVHRCGSEISCALRATQPIRTAQAEFCWRGRIRIALRKRAAMAGAICSRTAAAPTLRKHSRWLKSEFIVAAELDGADREARIFLAAPISVEDLNRHFRALMKETAEIRWDERAGALSAKQDLRLGALLLASADIRDPDPNAKQQAVLAGLKQVGVAGLPWTKELRQWRARVMLMRQYSVPSPVPWPDRAMRRWTAPWRMGRAVDRWLHAARALRALDLGNARALSQPTRR